jgi:hypothetical protein
VTDFPKTWAEISMNTSIADIRKRNSMEEY